MSALRMAVRAELTKARSLRSTWWSLLVATALSIGLSALIGLSLRDARLSERNTWDPVRYGYFGLTIGLIVLVVFGVMLVSGEFTSGTIRASLAAVPRRGVFLGAKVLAGAGIAAVVSVVCGFGAFLAVQPVLGDRGTSLGEPGVLRAVFGACLYLALMAVFAMGVAAMLRSTALCLGIMIPILFLNSQGLSNLPAIRPVTQFLPDQAGMVLMQSVPQPPGSVGHTDFGWAGALLVLLAWTAAALAGGFVAVRRLDP
ncbi:MAG TPA: ABC transporter permease subunit [Actinophytocola sp.]|nr:ABC transporter permease subunit [Actinophytocola sp.]